MACTCFCPQGTMDHVCFCVCMPEACHEISHVIGTISHLALSFHSAFQVDSILLGAFVIINCSGCL